MSTPQILARPLAKRIAQLAEPHDYAEAPAVPPAVAEAAANALRDGQTHYTDRPGIAPLREMAVSELGRRFGVELDANEVTITCGATEARFVALKQLTGGKAIAALGHTHLIAQAAALINSPIVQQVSDPAAVSVLYLTPADDTEAAKALLAQAAANNWWIVFDTSVEGNKLSHPALDAALASHVVSIGSYSRHLPGWRVGWMGGSSAANKLRGYKQSMTICTTSISQWAALGLEAES